MASVVMVAHLLGRRGGATQALALCVVVLLIADPWLATNYGFQLSVLATLGILELAPALASRMSTRLPKWLALTLSVSIAAQMTCLPVLLQLQAGLSTYSIPANLIAEPLVAPITILGILACLFSPFLPWLSGLLAWVASLGTWVILAVARFFADAPAAIRFDWGAWWSVFASLANFLDEIQQAFQQSCSITIASSSGLLGYRKLFESTITGDLVAANGVVCGCL
jgi:competence protein ComEC